MALRRLCSSRSLGKHEIEFVRVAQTRFHKKATVPLFRGLKLLFIKQRRHSFEIRTAELKMTLYLGE
jgi:hypothetical protein